ncbi:MAG: hypothetical protein ACSLEX_03245 [Minisyncoccota bacterium]
MSILSATPGTSQQATRKKRDPGLVWPKKGCLLKAVDAIQLPKSSLLQDPLNALHEMPDLVIGDAVYELADLSTYAEKRSLSFCIRAHLMCFARDSTICQLLPKNYIMPFTHLLALIKAQHSETEHPFLPIDAKKSSFYVMGKGRFSRVVISLQKNRKLHYWEMDAWEMDHSAWEPGTQIVFCASHQGIMNN